MFSRHKYAFYLALFPLLLLVFAGHFWQNVQAEPDAVVLSVDPTPANISSLGSTVTVDILVSGVTDLYGVSLALSFDPSIVEVVDAQLTPGSCPIPDFIIANTADNLAGTLNYDASSLSPSSPCSGSGLVASITFRGLAVGTSPVHFSNWLLADTNGSEITSSTVDGEIVVSEVITEALLWLDPQFPNIPLLGSGQVDLVLSNISNVYGAEMALSFDPTILQVVGASLSPGSCPAPDFVVSNTADNTAGSIDYAVTQLNPTPPCSGGTVATIEFQCIAESPSTDVLITSSNVSDPDGVLIPHNTQNATVECSPAGFQVTGSVSLQAWPGGPEGITVVLKDSSAATIDQVVVGPSGDFSLTAADIAETYSVEASYPRYLSVKAEGIIGSASSIVDLGPAELPAGDINGDGQVNIQDLVVAGGNWGKSSPQGWLP
jgi:hypothetical protein